ncbi:MAG: hypothetical protein ACLFPS_03360 [Clostridia bacterium]
MALDHGVLLFVEGETEVVFYELLIETLKEKGIIKKIKSPFILKNLKGIGGFKRVALSFFDNEIKSRYKNTEFCIALAYDTDIFEYDRQPSINWDHIDFYFRHKGVSEIVHIKQKYMIEDVFLEDYQGILKFLKLPAHSKMPKGNGYEKLQLLFNRANKIYYKGYLSRRFLQKLDMYKIYLKRQDVFEPFVRILNDK